MTPILRRFEAVIAVLAVLAGLPALAGPAQLRFFAIGDLPYGDGEHLALEALLAQELPKGTPFLVHVGDIKGGSAPCTDAALARIAGLFRDQAMPVVFTPGDNEWTDCRRPAAGGYDPQERLAALRRLYYGDPGVLRLGGLDAVTTDDAYPENYYFQFGDVLFAAVHVVGSHNNRVPADAAALAEHQARSAANRRHLRLAAGAAREAEAEAFVLLLHANPGLERGRPPRGFGSLHQDLAALLQEYPGPVLVIHGDTHRYRFDHPWKDRDGVGTRLARLEVPGSPRVGGVWVRVDPQAAEPFAVEPAYPQSRGLLLTD